MNRCGESCDMCEWFKRVFLRVLKDDNLARNMFCQCLPVIAIQKQWLFGPGQFEDEDETEDTN